MPPLPPLTVVFDLDGTLVDTAPDLIHALNHVLAARGLPPAEPDLVRPAVAHGARAMMEVAFKAAGHSAKEPEFPELLDAFLGYYTENIAVASAPYPGLIAVLDRVADVGGRLAVCTNKAEALSRKLLTELAMFDRFHALIGRDTLAVCKPDPATLHAAIERAGGDATRAVLVGDSETDIKTARAAEVPIIGVTFGYTSPGRPMRSLAPDAIIEDYDSFFAALAAIDRMA